MKIGLFLIVLLASMGCGDSSSSKSNNGEGNNGETNNDAKDMGTEDMGDTPDAEPDAEVVEDVIPERITTSGARFTGKINAHGKFSVKLDAFEGDRIVLWFTQTNGSTWDPALQLFRPNISAPVTYSDPDGDVDASIPWRASDLDTGFEFWYGGEYTLVFENHSDSKGDFLVELECVGGPCLSMLGDLDADGSDDGEDNCIATPNPSQSDDDGDGIGDACDPDYSRNSYDGLQDSQLESAMRTDKQSIHQEFTYRNAREYLFGTMDNVDGKVECVYTGTKVATVGIPDGSEMNTEHTWPQSRGGDLDGAQSDLHHLYPVTPSANIQRSNLFYGKVLDPDWQEGGSKRGGDETDDTRFEPRDSHKGNAARSLFYIAVMYQLDLDSREEALLRTWHVADPVDDTERLRNQFIANYQGSRNPFVDDPGLVARINNF